MPKRPNAAGFSMVEVLVSMTVLVLAMSGLYTLLVQNSKINKDQQLAVEAQSNARNCMSMIVQSLRSAGWDPMNTGIDTVTLDPDTTDDVSQIEVFADLDEDGLLTSNGEATLIRHANNRVEWRRTSSGSFATLAENITNDADGDGVIEPMFTTLPSGSSNPSRITVQITARSPVPDAATGDFVRYTVRTDVVLRDEL